MDHPDAHHRTPEGQLDSALVRRLLQAARDAARQAYVPYSGFPVGAAVLTDDGAIVGGVNIENASYGLTVCGERVAIFTAAASGHRTIRAVAISAPKLPGTTPCGACRQVMNEFKPQEGELIVILDANDGPRQIPLSALLPEAFGPRDLADASRSTGE
ncbi:MAG TPA: cytidine deaminase [Thermomicrobiales bacterium]|nr:cytidine deaminase [Thermomicrobiales bacterium]